MSGPGSLVVGPVVPGFGRQFTLADGQSVIVRADIRNNETIATLRLMYPNGSSATVAFDERQNPPLRIEAGGREREPLVAQHAAQLLGNIPALNALTHGRNIVDSNGLLTSAILFAGALEERFPRGQEGPAARALLEPGR